VPYSSFVSTSQVAVYVQPLTSLTRTSGVSLPSPSLQPSRVPCLYAITTPAARGPPPNPRDQLVRTQGIALHPDQELVPRQRTLAAGGDHEDLGVVRRDHRERVACGRRRPEVAADRGAVADLRRADRPGRLDPGADPRELLHDARI